MGAVTYAALFYPLSDQFRCLPICAGSLTSKTERAQYILVSSLAMPALEQLLLLLIVLYLRRDRQRIWKPYSYIVLGIHTAIGIGIGEQIVFYGVIFQRFFDPTVVQIGEARAIITETVVFMMVIIPFLALSGLLAGSTLLYERAAAKTRTLDFSGLPDVLVRFTGTYFGHWCLFVRMTVIRAIPEVVRSVIASQSAGASDDQLIVVYLLLAALWLAGVFYMALRVLKAVRLLDPETAVSATSLGVTSSTQHADQV